MTSTYEFVRDTGVSRAALFNFLASTHKTVAALLADGSNASFCYSAEIRESGLRLHVRSSVPPKSGEYSETPKFSAGEIVSIRIEARLEKRVNGRGKSPNRVYALDDDEARDKIRGFLVGGGFEVAHLSLSEPEFIGKSRGVHGYARTVVALVRVSDPHAARLTVASGFGRGKSYGFGFIHVAR